MNRLNFMTAAAVAVIVAGCGNEGKPVIPKDAELEKRVEKTLSRMSLDEKIGQMTQITIDAASEKSADGNSYTLNEEKLAYFIDTYKVGSFLNTPVGKAMPAAEWNVLVKTLNDRSLKVMGIPTLYGLDHIHGTTYISDGTLFPQPIAVAATFNREVARLSGEITAYESRAADVPWSFNPTLDSGRDPRWPRFWENYGEDWYVNAEMGKATILGEQGSDPNPIDDKHIAVSVKHYLGYGAPFSGKDRTPAYISPLDLRGKYFAPYLEALRAGALSFMVNSASINGTPVHCNPVLLTQWLKDETGWDGMIVTDWADINNLYTREKVAADMRGAVKLAINAGIDMSMVPYSCDFCETLKSLVEDGEVPMSRIDDAVRRVLRLKYRLGLFDTPDTSLADYPDFGCEAFSEASLHAAEESAVLLKNNGILPLRKGMKILVTGPNANQMRCLNGGWSYSWQGHLADDYAGRYNTIYEALCEKFGASNVRLAQGVTYNEKGKYYEENFPADFRPADLARGADVIVACIGENSYCESPGNLTDINLSPYQKTLVKAFEETGKPVVLILNEGRPRLISELVPKAAAVVGVMLPGNRGGDALANLLSGEVNFSGKLPFTYPKEINSLINYDYKVSEEVDKMEGAYDYNAVVSVQWAFGYGLSYTTFAYSNMTVDRTEFSDGDVLTVSVDVTNTGKVAGKESVLLFSSDLVASIIPESRRLREFTKVELQPGETKTVTFSLPANRLAFVGFDGRWTLEEGDFRLQAGTETAMVRCTKTKVWDTPNI